MITHLKKMTRLVMTLGVTDELLVGLLGDADIPLHLHRPPHDQGLEVA